MKIVRKENGNVLLTDDSGNTIKRLPEYAVLELKSDREGEFVRVAYGHQNKHDIYSNQITATQVEPAAEVAFNGTAQDLLNLLSTSFFFEVSSAGGEEVVFQDQDISSDLTNAIWSTRHTYSGELEAGTYQIDSYQELGIQGGAGIVQNGIRIDSVINLDQIKGQVFQLTQAKQILNRFIYVHSGGTVLIEAQFRRFTAATTAQCNFSNLIIKKIG
jgi:hypothetical protein